MDRILRAGSQLLQAGGVAFSPTDLPNLALWLDATKITGVSNGAALTTWNDSSGLGRNAGSGVNATYRTNVRNGLPVVRYAAGYHTISNSKATFKFLHYDGATVFVVASFGTSSNPDALYSVLGTNVLSTDIGYVILWDDRSSQSRNNAISNAVFATNISVSSNIVNNFIAPQTYVVLSNVVRPQDATAANRSELRVNNGTVQTNNTQSGAASSANATNDLQIGAAGGNRFPATADFAELIIYAAPLADADRQRVERYLGAKWGIAVA